MFKKIFLTLLILFILTSQIFAQKSSTSKDYERFKWFKSKPSIEVSYGLSDIKLNGYNSNFANVGLLELKLGFTSQQTSKFSRDVLRYHNGFLFLSNISSDLSAKTSSSGIATNLWRFGLGSKEGYGVKIGSVSLMPYNSNSFVWSRFTYDKLPDLAIVPAENQYAALDNFNEAFRFGSSTEGGINLQLAPGFSIQPKYEIADIYPRHLFGKQFTSSLIEISGLFLIDTFVKRILRNAPVAGTFVNFILKNAYEYGFYQLRKSQMNWPFTSEAPLRYSSFKLGMTFTF